MRKSELTFTAILVPLDFVMIMGAGLFAWLLRTSSFIVELRPVLFYLNLPFEEYLALIALIGICLLVIFSLVGLYSIRPVRRPVEDLFKIIIGVSAGLMILVFYIFIRQELFNSRFLVLAGWLLTIVFVTIGRYIMSKVQTWLIRKYKFCVYRTLIIGRDGVSEKIINNLKKQPALGCIVVGNLTEPDLSAVAQKVKSSAVEEIILADPNWPKETILDLVEFCEEKNISFKFVPNLFQTLTSNTLVEVIGGIPIVELKRTALDGWGRIVKRLIDIVGSLFAFTQVWWLFIVIPIIIKIDSKGPVFMKLKRISQGKEFYLYKFRSMVKDAESMKKDLMAKNERKDGPLFKMKDDPRVTRVGRLLRKFRVDEFPQLVNVLKGEMSLVGPRPHQPDEVAQYQRHHKKVLAIKPGMTGMAQVSGSSDLSFEDEVKLDTYYIENWSLFLDIKLLLKTIVVLWRDRSAV